GRGCQDLSKRGHRNPMVGLSAIAGRSGPAPHLLRPARTDQIGAANSNLTFALGRYRGRKRFEISAGDLRVFTTTARCRNSRWRRAPPLGVRARLEERPARTPCQTAPFVAGAIKPFCSYGASYACDGSEQPTKLRILRGGSPRSANCL